jgi:hypothetical protein
LSFQKPPRADLASSVPASPERAEQFTPGPWGVRQAIRNLFIESAAPGFNRSVARITSRDQSEPGAYVAAEANARLIAASPTMYANIESTIGGLELLLMAIEHGDTMEELMLRVGDLIEENRKALASARPAAEGTTTPRPEQSANEQTNTSEPK